MDAKGRLIELSQGILVEEDLYNVVRKLQDYDPNIRIKYLNPEARAEISDAPYAIFELCPDGIERLIFTVFELDDRILQRLYAADTTRHNILTNISTANEVAAQLRKRRYTERQQEVVDIMKKAFLSPKGKYSFEIDGKHILLDDDPQRRAIVRPVGE